MPIRPTKTGVSSVSLFDLQIRLFFLYLFLFTWMCTDFFVQNIAALPFFFSLSLKLHLLSTVSLRKSGISLLRAPKKIKLKKRIGGKNFGGRVHFHRSVTVTTARVGLCLTACLSVWQAPPPLLPAVAVFERCFTVHRWAADVSDPPTIFGRVF